MAELSPGDLRPPLAGATFEQSLARLQVIVDQLEDGQLTLAQSLAAYEEGIKHLQVCHAALTDTERKIEVLSGFNAAGEPITRPFDDTASHTEESTPRPTVARRSRKAGERMDQQIPRQCEPDSSALPSDHELDGRRELF